MSRLALVIGPVTFLLSFLLPDIGNHAEATRVAGLSAWMATWWLSAVVPLEVTALLPVVILPLIGAGTIGEVTSSYADPIIFLFMGGFFMGAALERWELHRRFALATVRSVGSDSRIVVLAFMLTSAFASMWISNTATAVMMLPIATAVAGASGESGGFPRALLLGVAYGCSIGGVSTLIGTPPNAILVGAVRDLTGHQITFAGWLLFGLTISLPLLVLCWLVLVRVFNVSGTISSLGDMAHRESARLGRLSGGDKVVLTIVASAAVAWIVRTPKELGALRIPGLVDLLPAVSDAGIAIAAAVLLFVVPIRGARFKTALDWRTARQIHWGVLILFGGGLALAAAFEQTGLTSAIGSTLVALRDIPAWVILLATAALFVVLTELTSNTATAALGMPIAAGAAQGLGMSPIVLMTAVALASSMAFMLPVATPPNAIVFSSGKIEIRDMARAGLLLNILSVVAISVILSLWPEL